MNHPNILTIKPHVETLEEVPAGCRGVPGGRHPDPRPVVVMQDVIRILVEDLLQLVHRARPLIIAFILHHHSVYGKVIVTKLMQANECVLGNDAALENYTGAGTLD